MGNVGVPTAALDSGVGQLRARRDELYARLERGWAICEAAARRADAGERERLDDHFIALLREYERTCDALNALAGRPTACVCGPSGLPGGPQQECPV
jgi:hypothetical protein